MLACAVALLWATSASAGPTDAEKCQADKLKRAALYSACRLKAESKAVKTGDPADYTKCEEKIVEKFGAAETKWGVECPTSGDVGDIQGQVTADSDFVALKLAGERFVDNGDGTVLDVETGLQWEQKDDLGGIHDKDNLYQWSATGTAPDGGAFITFLATLNNGTSGDGTTISGCFAGHCDWRLPTSAELQTILLEPFLCGTQPCIDPIFGSTQSSVYWSSTTDQGNPVFAWYVSFGAGSVSAFGKSNSYYVRAVRGGL
jgi:hypothetical protein